MRLSFHENGTCYIYDQISEKQPVIKKNVLLCYLLCRVKMPPSKLEANPTLSVRVRHASFSLFPLASLCSNDHSHLVIIVIDM